MGETRWGEGSSTYVRIVLLILATAVFVTSEPLIAQPLAGNPDCLEENELGESGSGCPCECPKVYRPVCGLDGLTYANDCLACPVGVAHQGPCAASMPDRPEEDGSEAQGSPLTAPEPAEPLRPGAMVRGPTCTAPGTAQSVQPAALAPLAASDPYGHRSVRDATSGCLKDGGLRLWDDVLDGDEVERLLAPTLADWIALVPGVGLVRDGRASSRFTLRGLSGRRTLLVLDGFSLSPGSLADGADAAQPLVDLFGIQQVEVHRGPRSARFGSQALGGTVAISSRMPALTAPGFTGSAAGRFASADLERTGAIRAEGRTGLLSLAGGFSALQTSELRAGDPHGSQQRPGYTQLSGDATGVLRTDVGDWSFHYSGAYQLGLEEPWGSATTATTQALAQGLARSVPIADPADSERFELATTNQPLSPGLARSVPVRTPGQVAAAVEGTTTTQALAQGLARSVPIADPADSERFEPATANQAFSSGLARSVPMPAIKAGSQVHGRGRDFAWVGYDHRSERDWMAETDVRTGFIRQYQDMAGADGAQGSETSYQLSAVARVLSLPRSAIRILWGAAFDLEQLSLSGIVPELAGSASLVHGSRWMDSAAFALADLVLTPQIDLAAEARVAWMRAWVPSTSTGWGTVVQEFPLSAAIAARFRPAPALGIHLGASTGTRYPGLRDLYTRQKRADGTVLPNEALSEEQDIGLDLGLSLDTERAHLELTGFMGYLFDLMAVQPTGELDPENLDRGGTPLPFLHLINLDEALVAGVEAAADVVLGDMLFYASLSWAHGQDLIADRPLSGVPPLQGAFGMSYRTRRWGVGPRCRFALPQDRLAEGEPETPGYAVLGLRGTVRLGDWGRVAIAVDNLADEGYRTHGSTFPEPGFNAIALFEAEIH